MDGLSAAASVIAVVQISKSVISACRQHYKTAKNARKDILEIISMVQALKGTLDTIKALLDEDDDDDDDGDDEDEDDDDEEDPRVPLLKSLEPSFAACKEAMRIIAQRLGIELGVEVDPGTLKVSFKKKATWPWKEKEVAKILESIEKFKTIFILALNGETLQVVRAIQESVKDISESIQKFTLSDKHKRILKWLKSSDPSVNHNAARKKHEPTTGDWLLESEIFINWKKATKSSIRINGKPGAGKTILCSTITEHIKCSIDSADSYAYFYFDFSDAEKQKVTSMLSSIVAQLSIPNLPAEVDDLYNKCKEGQQQPSQDDLVKILIAQCKESQRTYLIVDALDECSERKDILLALRRIIEASVQVNVLVTSREEHDISEGLRDVIPKSVSLECGGLDKDIERHIQRCLEKDGEWRKDPSYVKKEIQDALVKGAHGMFRWVECQLSALKECINLFEIRQALAELPDTLDDTYARILEKIPKRYRKVAHSALQLLAVSYRPLIVEEVAEATAVDYENEKFDPVLQRPRDPFYILKVCSGLVMARPNTEGGDELRFSHFSVKEYLVSERVSSGISANFRVIDSFAHELVARISLVYLLTLHNAAMSPQASILFMDFPFSKYSAEFWPNHLRATEFEKHRKLEDTLARKVFEVPAMATWLTVHDPDSKNYPFTDREGGFPLPLYYSSLLGFGNITEWLLDGRSDINAQGGFSGNALQAASRNGNRAVVELLLEKGADVNVQGGEYGNALQAASRNGNRVVVELLLEKGADVNDQGGLYGNALQAASLKGNRAVIELLLEKGADVNAQGGEYGNALQAASRNGNRVVVELLLEKGADVNAQGGLYGNALQVASYCGRQAIVELLLEKSADVNAQCGFYGNALQAASLRSHRAVIELLLEKGADVNAQGGEYGNALQAASITGNRAVIELLVEKGADVVAI